MSVLRNLSVLLIFMVLGTDHVSAQVSQCSSSDAECIATEAIMTVLNQNARQQGLREYVLGTVCQNQSLIDRGKAAYASSINSVVNASEDAVRQALGPFSGNTISAIVPRVRYSVRTARNSQAAGMISGLESVFGMYPRTRGEYCARMTPQRE